MNFTEKIKSQIFEIKNSGVCNMLSVHEVQRYAYNNSFYELVDFIETDKKSYVKFILKGEF